MFGIEDRFSAVDLPAWEPVAVRVFRPRIPHRFGFTPALARELAEFGPDLVHTHGLWRYPSLAAIRYCRSREVPHLISPHGMLDPWAMRHSRWRKLVAWHLYEQAHLSGARCLHALCEPEARAIRRLGLRNPVAIIRNGIDLPALGDGGQAGRGDRGIAATGGVPWQEVFEPGRRILLYLGRIHPKKGLMGLLRGWAATATDQPRSGAEWSLAIAGGDEGGHERALKRACEDLGLGLSDLGGAANGLTEERRARRNRSVRGAPRRHVVFLGPRFQEAKTACLAHCSAFVLPSLSEGVPMAVLEAWSFEKPVLMTAACNLPEGFERGAAIRIGARGAEEALRTLFGLPAAELEKMGRAGRRIVAERYSWPRAAVQMQDLYRFVMGGGQPPDCVADF